MKKQPVVNILEKIQQGMSFAEAMAEVPAAAFIHRPGCLCCSDGRFSPESQTLDKEGMAGQGVLLLFSETELNDFIAKLKNNSEAPQLIASHEGCGAAAIAFKAIKELMAKDDDKEVARIFAFLGISQLPATADELGIIYTKRLAEMVGIDYGHMNLPEDKTEHNESGIIVTDIDFDESFVEIDDQQFFNSASPKLGLSDSYIATELTKLTEIAFSDHGRLGHHPDENFYLLVISSPQGAERLKAIAETVAQNPNFSGRVKVDVFVKNN
ncbi:MAG TPA: hypothetical protein PKI61_02825 [bacterium]|nr:hypothetical protein [bacterium]